MAGLYLADALVFFLAGTVLAPDQFYSITPGCWFCLARVHSRFLVNICWRIVVALCVTVQDSDAYRKIDLRLELNIFTSVALPMISDFHNWSTALKIDLPFLNLLAVPNPHLLLLFLARQPSPPWKSQVAHLDMHHLVFGINFQIHYFSLASHVSIHFLVHLSTHLCHHPHSRHPLLHSFTPGSKPTFSTNPSHLRFFYLLDCLHDNGTGPDLSRSLFYF